MIEQIDIKFDDLWFTAKAGIIRGNQKQVLKGVCGEFRASDLTGVIGPSGAGKSSLLNILSGFSHDKITGSIRINGEERNEDLFRKSSTYIMQEENLHGLLTVREAMAFSVKLKTGNAFSPQQQRGRIVSTLETLKLNTQLDTLTQNLSGGQRKRLSIALELVDDPPILFLDEPTTGLDSSSATQCIRLLKKLAQEGKTIICTIHSPSALLLELFDHLYALADGCCIYQGTSNNLVPFLAELDLICPETFNPADFLLEIATDAYGQQNQRLVKKIENGSNSSHRRQSEIGKISFHKSADVRSDLSSSFYQQFNLLMLRNFVIIKRDKSPMILRFLMSVVVAGFVGGNFINNGHDAAQMLGVFKYIFLSMFYLMYSSYYSLQTAFSLEQVIVKREHFNRWYSCGAYYLALSITDVPITIISGLIYVVLSYILTNQPWEEFRFLAFLFIGLLTSFTAQGFGMMAGSLFGLKGTLVFGAVFLPTFAAFSGVAILKKDASDAFHWMFEMCFVKHSFYGACSAILGYNREKFDCDIDYCHYRWPHKFLQMVELDEDVADAVKALLYFLITLRVAAFLIMNYRLKH